MIDKTPEIVSPNWKKAQEGEKKYWIRKTSSSQYLNDHANSFRSWVPGFLHDLNNNGFDFTERSKILQIGSGLFDIIDFLPKGKRFAIDPLESYFFSLKNGHRNARVIRKEAMGEYLPFRDNTFDLVISHNMLDHVDSVNSALSECHRVLKSNGRFWLRIHVFQSWSVLVKKLLLSLRIDTKHLFFWTQASLTTSLEQSNFNIINGTLKTERTSLTKNMQWPSLLKKVSGISPIRLTAICQPSLKKIS